MMIASKMLGIDAARQIGVVSFFGLIVATAVFGARSDVGGWNDATRFATVESLVDYHTLSIDQSQFTAMTYDKVCVDGHFYSDKPPVPALWQALVYTILQALFGLHASSQPDLFCFTTTLCSSGLAYVLAALSVYFMAGRLELSSPRRLLLTGSFAFATLAPVYSRQVNSHILQLATVGWLMVGLIPIGASSLSISVSLRRAIGLGMLTGLTYTIDLGVGPVIVLGTLGYLAWKADTYKTVVVVALSAFPFFALHHALNYAIGHTFAPVNTVPEYFHWNGSPFQDGGLTGTFLHKHLGICLRYGFSLLIGEHGFYTYQPVVCLAVFYLGKLFIRRVPEKPQLCLACFWCIGSWAVYTVGSNNCGGLCCSVRWFLPLLAPICYVLALALRYYPHFGAELAVASGWGTILAIIAWWHGPWATVGAWPLIAVQAGSFASWIAVIYWGRRRLPIGPPVSIESIRVTISRMMHSQHSTVTLPGDTSHDSQLVFPAKIDR